jgi:hypothetical protein
MEADVFGSWVIWIWEICGRPVFRQQWEGEDGVEYNYVEALRKLITVGLLLNDKSQHVQSRELRRTAFFVYAAAKFASEGECMKWLKPTQLATADLDDYLKRARNYRDQLGFH